MTRKKCDQRLRDMLFQCRSLPMQYRSSKRASFETRRRIDRLVEALTAGSEPMPSVGPALVGLDRERERLERDLAAAQARDVTPTGIEVIVHELVAAVARLRDVLETGEPEERKAVV